MDDDYIMDYRSACAEENIEVLSADNFEDFNYTETTYEEFSEACDEYNIDINKILVCRNMPFMNNIFYNSSNGVYEPIMLDPRYFKMFKFDQRIKHITNKINKYYTNKEWDMYFAFVPDTFKIIEYERLFKELDKENKFEAFKCAYLRLDRALGLWKKEIVEEIIEIGKEANNPNNNNIITIYRGEGSKSLLPTEAISWTTSKRVAKSFANRGNHHGIIHTATVKEKDVVIIDDTGEYEVWVKYDDLLTIDDLILE